MTAALKLTLFVVAAALSGAGVAQIIFPAAPRYLEPVYLRHGPNPYEYWQAVSLSMETGTLVVRIRSVNCADLCGPSGTPDVLLGRFPTGIYPVRTILNDSEVILGQFTVASTPDTQIVDYSGMWWLPSESGWGLSIAQGPTGILFAVWFAYDEAGEPTWYTLQARSGSSAANFAGTLYKTSGPYFGGETFDPTQVTVTPVGSGTLSFARMDIGDLVFNIDGHSVTKRITRQAIE